MSPDLADPTPLRELQGETPSASRACRDAEAVVRAATAYRSPPQRRAALYWDVRARLERGAAAPSRPRRLLLASAVATAAFVAAALAWWRPLPPSQPARLVATAQDAAAGPSAQTTDARPAVTTGASWLRFDLGEVGTIETSPSAVIQVEETESEHLIRVRSGVLRAQVLRQQADHPVVILTPHLRIVVVGTRFDVWTDERRTLVSLIEGAVRLESVPAGAAMLLRAGETAGSDDPRLQLPPAEPAAPAPPPIAAPRSRHVLSARSISACEQERLPSAQERCFESIAAGRDLAAEAAMLRLASLAAEHPRGAAAALERLSRYAARFPDGTLGAEAAMRELELLMSLGRFEELAAAAGRFKSRFPADPRASEAAVARASALCRLPGRVAEALATLGRLDAEASPEVRKAAFTLRERCGAPAPPHHDVEGAGSRRLAPVPDVSPPQD